MQMLAVITPIIMAAVLAAGPVCAVQLPGGGQSIPVAVPIAAPAPARVPVVLLLPVGGAVAAQVAPFAAPDFADVRSMAMPVNVTRVSSRFGVRRDPSTGGLRMHRGIDIPDIIGAPVRTAAGGIVSFAGWSRGYGNLVEIDHGHDRRTRYGHLSHIVVTPGMMLRQGALLGLVGSTGRSTGPHVHFEVRQNGVAVDPLTMLHSLNETTLPAAMPPMRASWNGYVQDAASLPQSQLR